MYCYLYRISCQRTSPYYTISAPSKLRPDIVYHVSVTLHDSPADVDFNVQIIGISEDLSPVNVVKDVHLEPSKIHVCSLRHILIVLSIKFLVLFSLFLSFYKE